MATENRDWGYRRIQGALANLGHGVARGAIANILKEHGLEPAPERERKTKGLTRFLVLFLIDLSTRKVEIARVTRDANGVWMSQIGRNLSDAAEGFLIGKRYLIHNRDPLFTEEFLKTIEVSGIESLKLPPKLFAEGYP